MSDRPEKKLGLSDAVKERLIKKMLEKRSRQESDILPVKSPVRQHSIPEAWYCFNQHADYQQICLLKATAKELHIPDPFFRVQNGIANNICVIDGKGYINFTSYNYLNLNGHPQVSAAAKAAIDQYGTSVSASRLVSGERRIHQQLEHALAKALNTDDCVVFVSGHATNVSSIGYLFGARDLILYDALIHNSIVQGALLSGAHRKPFPHNSCQAVDDILTRQRREYERVLIVVEGIYSMDGDVPNLPEWIKIKQRHKALLMVDEAHSFGVLGEQGKGIASHFRIDAKDIDISMGTLSKALASAGGYIAGDSALIELLRTYAPGFLYSVGISPPAAAAALAALQVMQREPERVAALRKNGLQFLHKAKEKGINTGLSEGYSVIPVIIGSSIKACCLADAMFKRGINVQPIFYPAVKEKSARLRFFMSSAHTEKQIIRTVDILGEELNNFI